jgi:CheY-like chemotaxis protein
MTSRRHTPNHRPRAVDCGVLVIDDNPMTLATIGTVLRRQSGLQVYEAPTGMAGIEMARRHPVVLALIDLRLPDMSGLDVARTLRQERRHVAWILMSGFMDYDAALEAGRLGALRAVSAMFDVEAVVSRALQQVAESRLWPPLPLTPHLEVPGNAAEYWAHLVLRACDAEHDLPTIEDWRKYVGVSYSALTEASRMLRIEGQNARDFMRVLRALFRSDGDVSAVVVELAVYDYRTRRDLLEAAGLADCESRRVSLQDYLMLQRFIRAEHPVLSAIGRVLGLR